jgi:signal transduction histidine kinase
MFFVGYLVRKIGKRVMTSRICNLKKDFISRVSHELKAPLASMRETIQLMLD